MIDLSRENKSEIRNQKSDEEPIGLIILGCIPFALLLYTVLTAAFLAG